MNIQLRPSVAIPLRLWFYVGALAALCASQANSLAENLVWIPPAPSAYEASVLSDSPILYYRFEEASGSAANNLGMLGVSKNGAFSATGVALGRPSAFPALGKAADFDGASGYIIVPSITNAPQGELTIEFWLNRRVKPENYWTALFASEGFETQEIHFNLVTPGSQLQWGVSQASIFPQGPVGLTPDEWHHIVATYLVSGNSGLCRFYLDGDLVFTTATSPPLAVIAASRIGAWFDNATTSRYLDGAVDEFAIYNRVLSDADVQRHYQAATSGATLPTLAYRQDFNGAIGAEWSLRTASVTPIDGRRFLGEFWNQTNRLTRTNLPPHTAVKIFLDLFILRSWDGSDPSLGPDLWQLRLADGAILISSTFNNHTAALGGSAFLREAMGQSYPLSFSSGSGSLPFPPFSGASEMNSLGYNFNGGTVSGPMNAVYPIQSLISHTSNRLDLLFSAANLQGLADEGWGIDNVRVEWLNAPAGVLAMNTPLAQALENGSSAILQVSRVGGGAGAVSVDYQTVNGTALAGQDFLPVSGTLNFADAETNKTVLIPILDNLRPGVDKEFRLVLSNPTGGAALGRASTTVTLLDDDGRFEFLNSAQSQTEITTDNYLPVRWTGATNRTVSVEFAAQSLTAAAGADFESVSGTLVFQPGETLKSIFFRTIEDAWPEVDEQALFRLRNPSPNTSLGTRSSLVFTIFDNDSPAGPGRGANWAVLGVLAQPDGRVLVSGGFLTLNGVPRGIVGRLNGDGSLDTGFAGADSGWGDAMALQPDGKLIVGGGFGQIRGTGRGNIARLNSNGTLDTSFQTSVGANGWVETALLQPDAKVLLGGWFTSVNGSARNYVARLNTNGTLDASFTSLAGPNAVVRAVAIQNINGLDNVLIGGEFTQVAGVNAGRIARLQTDGTRDPSFNSGGAGANANIHAILVQPDGKILLAGEFTTVNGTARNRVARLHSNGTLDTSFDAGPVPTWTILGLARQADGKVLIGGGFYSYVQGAPSKIARLNSNGSVDGSFKNPALGNDDWVSSITVLPDSRIVIGGYFTTLRGVPRYRIAFLNSDGTLAPDGSETQPPTIRWQPTSVTTNLLGAAVLSVTAEGGGTLTYQWRRNGDAISGATNTAFSIGAVSPAVLRWSFTGDYLDSVHGLAMTPINGATLSGGRLVLNGAGAFGVSDPLPFTLREMTLEAWVLLNNVDSENDVFGVEIPGAGIYDEFDAIVLGEMLPQRWMSGSHYWRRTQFVDGPIETRMSPQLIHLAITYGADGRVSIYRNGAQYGTSYKTVGEFGVPREYPADLARVVFGQRTSDAGGGYLSGAIDEARIYDRALSAGEVAASFLSGPNVLPAPGPAPSLADSGDYDVVISNAFGATTSAVARVTMLSADLAWIPPGSFLMGSPTDVPWTQLNENPRTQVTLTRGFWMNKYEVTQSEFQSVMGFNPSHFTNSTDRPVEQVSWLEAKEYCSRLTEREGQAGRLTVGHIYRLPTEAEWEYACRAGTTTDFSFGDDVALLSNYGWHYGNSGCKPLINDCSQGATRPVGLKLPNPWGLYDMHGNAGEFVLDGPADYPGGAVTDPVGPLSGATNVFRGPGWDFGGPAAGSAIRWAYPLGWRDDSIGFRVVLAPGVCAALPTGLVGWWRAENCATTLYAAAFEGAVGPEWSSSKVGATPVGGRKFLGEFGNQTVTLTLTDLPPHTAATVEFDLFLIRSWDGNGDCCSGIDVWDLGADGAPPLLRTTFSNSEYAGNRQAYPGPYPGGDYPGRTGAVEVNTLGYTFSDRGLMDSVYRPSFTFAHASNTIVLSFSASGLQVLTDESWGLDNVQVTVFSSPVIMRQPASQFVEPGGRAQFSVEAAGLEPLHYQWRKNGTDISGANAASYTIVNAQTSDAATYSVVVANDYGRGSSSNATLAVTPLSFGGPQLIHPSADARILLNAPSHRDGASVYLSVYNIGGNNIQRTLIQFDLSSLGVNAEVTNAVLKLYADASLYFGGNPGGQPMEIYRLTQPWKEADLTWNNRTAKTPWTALGGDYVGTTGLSGAAPYAVNSTVVPDSYQALSPKELNWNITALVKEWQAGIHPNYGLVLLSRVGNRLHFHSQESGAAIPVLEVYDANRVLPAVPVYSEAFEGVVGKEWSSTKVSTTPVGARRFLGNFGNQFVRLTLTNLPPHTALELAFDLFVIQSWDGNNTFYGPDLWDLQVLGGPVLLHTTFAHALPDNYIYPDGQAYPGDFPGGRFRPFTGAAEIGTLGYTFNNLGPMNSVYRHTFAFSHVGDTVQLQFSASGLQALTDESWGLDNVQVRAYAAPAGVLQFRRPYFGATEDGTNAIVTVERVGGSLGMVSAQVVVVGGTAHAGLDFVAPAAEIFFADGETNKTLLIPLLNDTIAEPEKHFSIVLSQPSGGVLLGSQSQTTVLLEDDDSTIAFALSTVLSPEGDANARVTVTRAGDTTSLAVARVLTFVDQGPAAATQGVDFISTELRVVFQPGEVSKDVFIPLNDDSVVELDETFLFQLSSPFGARLGPQSTTRVMILDNDTPAGAGRGANWQVQTLVVQPDGKFLIGGGFDQVNAGGRASIARLNADGSLDATFNPGSGANNWIETIALQPDGRILIGGWFTTFNGTTRNRIARLNANGSLDVSFDPGAGADNTVYKVVVQPDGKILLAGAFTNARGVGRNRIARLNSNGALDATFNPGTGADNIIYHGLAVQSDGKIIVSGQFGTFNGAARLRLVRLNPDGAVDNTFSVGSGLNGRANAILVLSDGKIVLGGYFTSYNGVVANRVARLNPNGTLDQTFTVAGGPNSFVQSMAVQADGKIVVVGSWTTWNGVNRGDIVRLNASGTLDNSFAIGPGANAYVGGVGILADGRVALAGNFSVLNGYNRARVAIVGVDGSQPPEALRWTQWKTADGGNDHWYSLTSRPENWNEAEVEAVAQGGHLSSIGNQNEQMFLENTFLYGLNRIRPFWIGFNDAGSEGTFVWSSGELPAYTNWPPGEPNNNGNEDYAALNWFFSLNSGAFPGQFGQWNDVVLAGPFGFFQAGGPFFGIMETTVNPFIPVIVTQPQSQTIVAGDNVTFSVVASGPGVLNYQWFYDGTTPIAGANNAILSLANAQPDRAGTYSVVVSNPSGSVTSVLALLTIQIPPFLTEQPKDVASVIGGAAIFTVDAAGTEPFAYRWLFNGVEVAGANTNFLAVPNVQAANGGTYQVIVSNPFGTVPSRLATLKVVTPPSLTRQPADASVPRDSSVTFCVEATGTPPFSFQWRKNGVNIAGATDSCYTIPKVRIEDGGQYSAIVTSEVGSVVSDSARLTITELPTGPPAEDDFVDRFELFGASGVVSVNNIGATKERGEPDHAGKPGGSSVWYTWQAPAKGIANFRTSGSSIDTLLAVYSGASVSNLLVLDSDEDRGGYLASEVGLNAQAGVFYQVAIDGYANSQGKFVLSWSFQATLEELPTITTQPKSQTVAKGAEALLQVVAAGQDLKYQWSLNGAPLAGANSSSLLIPHVQPEDVGTYTVRVANGQLRTVDSQSAVLEIGNVNVQSQDKIEDLFLAPARNPLAVLRASATAASFVSVRAGTIGSHTLNNSSSTNSGRAEVNTLCGLIGGERRWFNLRAEDGGILSIDTQGSLIDTLLGVFTLDFTGLVPVSCNDNGAPDGRSSLVRFAAVPGTDYLVGVDGVDGETGVINLNWSLGVPLTVRRQGNTVRLSWPASFVGFVLEEASALPQTASPLAWPPVSPGVPTVVNGTNTLSLPLSKTTKFYRLRQP